MGDRLRNTASPIGRSRLLRWLRQRFSVAQNLDRGGEAMTYRILLALAAVTAAAQPPGPRTLRLDYVHTGTAAEEHFALDGVVLEGAWPGPLDRWTDESRSEEHTSELQS